MARLSKREKRFIIGLFTAFIVGLLFCSISYFNLLYSMHLKSNDFLYMAADSSQKAELDGSIVIIGIDDRSLEELGHFSSWPRTYHARLIDTLNGAGARLIVFDILFSEQAPGDEEVLTSIIQAGNVILPFAITSDVNRQAVYRDTTDMARLIKPLDSFKEGALAIGHANLLPDADGIVRGLPLIISTDGHNEPALALTSIAKYLRRSQIIEAPIERNYLPLAGRSIPLDDANNMLINYSGSPETPLMFQTVSYVDVLSGDAGADIFNDKIVLIGATATALGDTFWTPLGRIMNGVEVHASAMHTILSGNFIRTAPQAVTMISILVLALICGLLVLRLRILWAALSTISLAVFYFLAVFYLFDHGIMMDTLYPPMTVASSFVAINLYNVTSERIEKREITRTFGRYVSQPVATMILNAIDEGSLRLGGEEKTVTVLFADIRNFTGITEKMDPQNLVTIVNRYLSVIIKTVLQYDGMVNKFGGDSIMAVWNAPVGCAEHALSATTAAVEAQRALTELQNGAINLPKMDFGIGVNTGNAVAGNMGSTDRLEYSVIGDAVNITARLAGITPGGAVWIGAGTFDLIKDFIKAEPLAPLSLKGKREKYRAYEVTDILKQP